MCKSPGRNPFHCIVPPHMLRVLEMRGDARQTEMARELLAQSRKVRDERAASPPRRCCARAGGGRLRAPAFAEAAPARHLDREIYDGGGKAALPGKLVRAEGADPTGDAAATPPTTARARSTTSTSILRRATRSTGRA